MPRHMLMNYADAGAYLHQRRETIQLLAIHQQYVSTAFPADLAHSQEKVIPRDEQTFSAAELHCIQEIDRCDLFPFSIDYVLMCHEEGERPPTIPLYSLGIDQWDRPFSDFELGWQLLLMLVDPIDEVGLEELGSDVLAILAQAIHQGDLQLQHLDAVCQAEKSPLQALPIAVRMINHVTGNAFLDTTDEMPCEPMYWDLEDVALLHQHWKEAKVMLEQTDALVAWLAADPPTQTRKAVDLWNRAQRI